MNECNLNQMLSLSLANQTQTNDRSSLHFDCFKQVFGVGDVDCKGRQATNARRLCCATQSCCNIQHEMANLRRKDGSTSCTSCRLLNTTSRPPIGEISRWQPRPVQLLGQPSSCVTLPTGFEVRWHRRLPPSRCVSHEVSLAYNNAVNTRVLWHETPLPSSTE